jgi:tetratricopeptide (TPR) repeat protein
MKHRWSFAALLLLLLPFADLLAQPQLLVPDASPKAMVGQRVGITDITINYHRPAVTARHIWGGLVPYDVIWRAGANENTTISFSTPVKVEGQLIPAGEYSLFMIPSSSSQWTVVINRFTGGWGTYSYDPSEDIARVKVTPAPIDMQERLLYTFDEPTANDVVAALRWEKLRVPFKIEADTPALVNASIRNELRSGKHWNAPAWSAAARWAMRQKDLDAALAYADGSIALGANPDNLNTKAALLERKGDKKGAAELREQARALSPESYEVGKAYQLAGAKKIDEAIQSLSAYASAHPSFRVYGPLGELYSMKGDAAKAQESFDKAMSLATNQSDRTEVQDYINSVGAEKK